MQYPQDIYLEVICLSNARMDRYELRRVALRDLVTTLGTGGISTVARAIDKAPSYVSRMLYEPGKAGRKRIGEDSWESLVTAFPEAIAEDCALLRRDKSTGPAAAADCALLALYHAMTPEQRSAWERVGRALAQSAAPAASSEERPRAVTTRKKLPGGG